MRAAGRFKYASLALIVGVLGHIIGHIMGPETIGFMGAPPDVVQGALDRTILYYVMMTGIIGLLSGLAWLAWTKTNHRVSRIILWIFSVIFTLRGALVLFFIPAIFKGYFGSDPTKFWFHFCASIFVLSIGLALVSGLWKTRVTHKTKVSTI